MPTSRNSTIEQDRQTRAGSANPELQHGIVTGEGADSDGRARTGFLGKSRKNMQSVASDNHPNPAEK